MIDANSEQRRRTPDRAPRSLDRIQLRALDIHLDHRWPAAVQYLIQRRDFYLIASSFREHRRRRPRELKARLRAAVTHRQRQQQEVITLRYGDGRNTLLQLAKIG